jgi:hypothetical protein
LQDYLGHSKHKTIFLFLEKARLANSGKALWQVHKKTGEEKALQQSGECSKTEEKELD